MGNQRWKKRGKGSQRKETQLLTMGQKFECQSPSSGSSFASVPNWEKSFCSQMKWWDFCKKKRRIHIFPNVLDWDDSAGKEAFDTAKARYWAEINNLPFETPLPDPNMYIQEVDYDAEIDPSLLEDLYSRPPPPPASPDPDSIEIAPTGWDVEDPSPTDNVPNFVYFGPSGADSCAQIRPTGWDDIEDELIGIIPTGWGDEKDSEMILDACDTQGREVNGDGLCSQQH